jgi:hypothetical protein
VLFTWTSINLGPPLTQSTTLQHSRLLKQWWRRVRKHEKSILLQQDKARRHTLRTTMMEVTKKLDLTILPHPPYSPNLAPKVKEDHRGHPYDWNEEVERTDRIWIKKKVMEFFRDNFQKLVHRWRKSVWIMVVTMWRSKCRS